MKGWQKMDETEIFKPGWNNKILTSSDTKEIVEGLAEDIYRDLIKYSNHYNSYQRAINFVQTRLKSLCTLIPYAKPKIQEAADKAGERFLKTIGEIKMKNAQLNICNVEVKQNPPKI